MNWFYAESGQQLGPLPQEQFDQLVAQGRITDSTRIRLKPALQRNTIAVRTLLEPIANYLKPVPTTYGDIQQKNRHAIFGGVETSMKMTFNSPGENQRATRRRRGSTFHNPPFIFPLGKCV